MSWLSTLVADRIVCFWAICLLCRIITFVVVVKSLVVILFVFVVRLMWTIVFWSVHLYVVRESERFERLMTVLELIRIEVSWYGSWWFDVRRS